MSWDLNCLDSNYTPVFEFVDVLQVFVLSDLEIITFIGWNLGVKRILGGK